MIYSLQRLGNYVCKAYAYVFFNALYVFSICFVLDFIQQALQHRELTNILHYFAIGLVPLLIWNILYLLVFRPRTKFFYRTNYSQKIISFFGGFTLTVTIVSILKDLQNVIFGTGNYIPGGIIGKCFAFVFKLDNGGFPKLSFWLIVRYLVLAIILFYYLKSLWETWRYSDDFSPGYYRSSPQKKAEENKTPDKPNISQRRKKLHGKKLNYIE